LNPFRVTFWNRLSKVVEGGKTKKKRECQGRLVGQKNPNYGRGTRFGKTLGKKYRGMGNGVW